MSNVSQLPSTAERKERRRLHLRDVAEDEGAQPQSVGALLRAARLDRGEETGAIAAILKMRAEQLDAIEEDDFARLPGRTYAVGFLRTYARHLGLDAEAVLQQFKDETAGQDYNKPADLVFPEAPPERQMPRGSILILALVIAMVIYGLSYLTMPTRKSATTAKAEEPVVVIDEPQAAAIDVKKAPDAQAQASFVTGDARLPETALPPAVPPVASPDAVLDGLMPQAVSFVIAQGEALLAVPSQTANDAVENIESRVTLTALQPTYIQIRERATKSVLISRILNPGEVYRAPDRTGLIMQTGNAGGLQVEVDGRMLGVLGRSGEVITRIPVDPSYFLERLGTTQ